MSRRTALTIVLITRQDLVRADFAPGSPPRLLGLWGQPRPDLPDEAALVEAAFTLGPKLGRQVWVLSSDFWTQNIVLPAIRATGLQDADLAAALNFEAEGMSGQAAFESTVGCIPQQAAAGERGFWMVQVRISDLEMIEQVVRRSGGALAGVAHPAGVPFALGAGSAGNWHRLELWSDAVACASGKQGQAAEVHIINSAPQLGQWQGEWKQRRGEHNGRGQEEMLVDVGVTTPPLSGQEVVIQLTDEASLRSWLTAWAATLARKQPQVPLVRPARRPMSVGLRTAIAVALAVLAIALCYGHDMWFRQSLLEIQKAHQAATEPGKRLVNLQKQAKTLEAERGNLGAQLDKLGLQLGNLRLQRHRLIQLTTCLSELQPEHLMIERVENNGGEPHIFGVCLRPELADLYAARLSLLLPPHGWKVDAPKKKTQDLVDGGGPCQFEIQLHAFGSPPTDVPTLGSKAGPKIVSP